jgi:hypothetical protein
MQSWAAPQPEASREGRQSPPWWARRVSPLWWSLPLAFVAALYTAGLAQFALCGLSGCGGRGSRAGAFELGFVFVFLAASATVLALPLVLTHWHSSLAIRVKVGLAVAVTWAGLNAAWMYSVL